MSLLREFREFAIKGNVVDLAVGIIIGVAFGKIVTSFVGDILMPPLGLLIGGIDFSNLAIVLQAASTGTEAVVIRYGIFLQTIVDFVIVAFAVFVVVRLVNRLRRKEAVAPAKPAAPTAQEQLLTEIRDLLRQR